MRPDIHKGFREEGVRAVSARQGELIRSMPTEPEAFLLRSTQREDGGLELSRGRVICNMIYTSGLHSGFIRNRAIELDRLLGPERFDSGMPGSAAQIPYGIRSPDIVVEHARPRTALPTATAV